MQSLITDLLAMSRVGAEAQRGSADPAAVVASLRDEVDERLGAAGAIWRADVEPARVRCNEGLLRQVLWNLVDNAFKYRRAEAPPEIDVRGRAVGARYHRQVSDRGAGIEGAEAARLFEPFFRAGDTGSRPGTGLGLSIVKRIVEVSGGTVSVASTVGQGSTFSVDLPLDAARPEATPAHRDA